MASSEANCTSILTFAVKVSTPCNMLKQSLLVDSLNKSKLWQPSFLQCFIFLSTYNVTDIPIFFMLFF